MDEELKKLLEENINITKENETLLRKVIWNQRLGHVFSVVKWVLIIGSAVGLFYYLQPLIDQTRDFYRGLIDSVGGAGF